MTSYAEQMVGNIAAANAATLRIFEANGIDYCCGGKLSLEQACSRAHVEIGTVIAALEALDRQPVAQPEKNWNDASASELINHIVEKHHSFVRAEIPRIEALLVKVNGRHGAAHPELGRVQELFGAVAQELQSHLMREEQVLFPYIRQMEASNRGNGPAPSACFGSVEFPISRMLADHDDAGELFASMRSSTNGYALPDGSCQSYAALYRALDEFERDLHQHIHLENNILFPRAIEIERVSFV